MRVIAYHVVLSFYGFWLPNDPRGSNSTFVRSPRLLPFGLAEGVRHRGSRANVPHDRKLRQAAKEALLCPPVVINGKQALCIARAFARQIAKSGYVVYAFAIMPDHVHLVIGRHRYKIEYVVNLLKGAATTALSKFGMRPLKDHPRPDGTIPSPWAEGLGKYFLFMPEKVREKIDYVNDNPVKQGLKRQTWDFVVPFGG